MLAIIFNPKALETLNSHGFYYEKTSPKATKGQTWIPVELDSVELKKGLNFVDPEVWEKVLAHGNNSKIISGMASKNAIVIYKADAEVPTGCSLDYSSLSAVEDMIRVTTDETWVKRSRDRDNRPRVIQLCTERLEELEEIKKYKRSQAGSTLELV